MNVELAIAAVSCFVLGLEHMTVGLRWVLPNHEGAPAEHAVWSAVDALGTLRFTWHMMTVLLLAFGILFTTLAWARDADPKMVLLRWFAGLWLAATATAYWNARRRPRDLLRLPLPFLFIVIAVMCWTAST